MQELPILRNEHSRSLSDAEKFKALDTLTELGLLIPFDKAGYAAAELTQSAEGIEPSGFVSTDSDARILDASFDPAQLNGDDKGRYDAALHNLAIPISEGSPVSFQAKDISGPVIVQMQGRQRQFITEPEVQEIAQHVEADIGVVDQLAGSYNARQMALTNPVTLASELLSAEADIVTKTVNLDGQETEIPVNIEYAARYLQKAHIVGVKLPATESSTMSSISLFEPNKVATTESAQQDRHDTWEQLGALTGISETTAGNVAKKNELPLLRTLKDAHAKPEQLIADARQVPGYAEIFDMDAGNWEGFTLAEHTETVLRNFDENFADKVPVKLLETMRLAIVAHDLGKPLAAANGERRNQKKYNLVQAADFFGKLDVDERAQGLLLAMIGEGQEIAFALDVRKQPDAPARMHRFAEETMQAFSGSDQPDPGQVEAFETMCRILHTVDGGAYTSMAITRRDGNEGSYRNAPSFNSTFVQPTDPGKRGIAVRQDGQAVPAADLTPRRAGFKQPEDDLDVVD